MFFELGPAYGMLRGAVGPEICVRDRVEPAKLFSNAAGASALHARVGESVGISGDTVVVGAPGDDEGGINVKFDSVYILSRIHI